MHPMAKRMPVAAGGGWAAPDPVLDLAAVADDVGGITLTWTQAFGATGYDIQRSLTNGNFATIAADQTGATYYDSSGDPNTLYYYRIIAKRRAVPSLPSNVVSATTVTVFSPLDIASLVEWWSVASLSALSDGDPVGSWVGEKQGITLAAAGGLRPLYDSDAGDGNGACVTPDGVDDILQVQVIADILTYFPNSSFEVWLTFKHPAGAATDAFEPVLTSLAENIGSWLPFSDDTIYFDHPTFATGRLSVSQPIGFDNVWHVVRFAKHGSTRIIELDGTQLATNSSASTFASSASFFLRMFANSASMSIRHQLLFNDQVSGDDLTALKTYLFAGYAFGP